MAERYEFESIVEVKIIEYGRSFFVESVRVGFDILIDYRKWGIKDIDIELRYIEPIILPSGEELKPELSDFEVSIAWNRGNSYTIDMLTIDLDNDKILVNAYYLVPV